MSEGMSDEETARQVREFGTKFATTLYEKIIHVANRFLHNCKNYSITVLALEDPTYEKVAKQLLELAEVIRAISNDFDPMMGQKAIEYCDLMLKMSLAIKNGDEESLSKFVIELSEKPGT